MISPSFCVGFWVTLPKTKIAFGKNTLDGVSPTKLGDCPACRVSWDWLFPRFSSKSNAGIPPRIKNNRRHRNLKWSLSALDQNFRRNSNRSIWAANEKSRGSETSLNKGACDMIVAVFLKMFWSDDLFKGENYIAMPWFCTSKLGVIGNANFWLINPWLSNWRGTRGKRCLLS